MRKIAIIGAGQAGMQLALSLLRHGYEVTVFSAVTPDQLRGGRPLSTQVLFAPALAAERAYGLNPWELATPPLAGSRITLCDPPGTPAITFNAVLEEPARSTDQRLKMSGWLEMAEQQGARVIYQAASAADVDTLAASGRYELVLVAAGRGELGEIFAADPARIVHTGPQRVISAAYVDGFQPDPAWPAPHMAFEPLPGIGEFFAFPALTLGGTCDILVWEAVIGGPADRGPAGGLDPEQTLDLILDLTQTFTPHVAARARTVTLTDPRGALYGRIAPRVRRPVARLPGGGLAFGVGDVLATKDPIAAQGGNSAAKAAAHYLMAILTRGDEPFTAEWMADTFETFWTTHGRPAQRFSNSLLSAPQPHHLRIFAAAAAHQPVADRFAHGLTDPRDLDWFTDPDATEAYLGTAALPPAELWSVA